MKIHSEYDVAIIGGGLAGLAAAIQLTNMGHSVILFEKEKYPFHKVCGEYISLESWNFLTSLGIPLNEMNLPVIDKFILTSPNGKSFTTKLPLGGFGISRFKLDGMLSCIAKQLGVTMVEETKVVDVKFDKKFGVNFQHGQSTIVAKVCCAAFGKRSNLDIKWNRSFLQSHDKKLDNYVAVKYHIRTDWQKNLIGLHNFKNGYCGISKIEDDKYCLCYMTKADNLKTAGNNIPELEKQFLYKNPHLKKIFLSAEICAEFPLTISQISFNKKTQVEDHMLMLGDAGGMITPLCGNGMSIALHTSKIAAVLVNEFLNEKISMTQMEDSYTNQWNDQFAKRLKTGRTLQRFFGSNMLSDLFVQSFRTFPFLAKPLIKMTHGNTF
ncbi:MAG: NAD(P)/FAD-dependent oxidoreductase [Flavisolibacter sp.]